MDNPPSGTNLFLKDIERLKRSVLDARFSPPAFTNSNLPKTPNPLNKPAQHNAEETELVNRVGNIARHLSSQWDQHQQAVSNTNKVFDRLLSELEIFCGCFSQQLPTHVSKTGTETRAEIDPDRSVGMLNLLWHTISFTTRGNSKPLAIYRYGQSPVFTGRIVALVGHFNDLSSSDIWQDDFSRLLPNELASLYIPSQSEMPAVMTIKHLGEEEYHLDQQTAPRQFLLKAVEMLSAGGHFHEKEFYN